MARQDRTGGRKASVEKREAWQWEEAEWRAAVDSVRAGRSLKPAAWPGGARVAVALSFDSDHETGVLRDGGKSPAALAGGQYGSRVGVPRILATLERHAVPATFFVPAVSALLYPDEQRTITAAGHELGIHGWIHERNSLLQAADERLLMRRAMETLTAVSGREPVGMRTPSWDYSPSTLAIIRELGLLYDSSLMADDDPYELLQDGAPTGVVEIPVEWIRDDGPYFTMERFAGVRPHTAPADVLDIWQAEFLTAYEEGGLFQLTMHPHIIGHRSRIRILEALLTFIREHPKVWFATHEAVARCVLAAPQ